MLLSEAEVHLVLMVMVSVHDLGCHVIQGSMACLLGMH